MIKTNLEPASNQEVERYLERELQLTSQQRDLMFHNEVLRSSGYKFYKYRTKPPTTFAWRMTMPFYGAFVLLLILSQPFRFLVLGRWYFKESFLDKILRPWKAKLGV
jgi:hypothetical protein